MSRLALLGGDPVRTTPLPVDRGLGRPERDAALRVLDRGVLSQFLGEDHPDFYGGPEVRAAEQEFAAAFGVAHAVSTNSATTGLQTALGACGVGPGDEVIVSPFTMSASAATIVLQHAVPVFADIDPRTYCLDPSSVRRCLTRRTRAIVAVDIFGQPAHWDELRAIAHASGLLIVEDAAQAAYATYRDERAGSLGNVGVLSLNYHKIIQAGEGGMLLTRDPEIAKRAQLIRNHGEVVAEMSGLADLTNIVGSNYRLTEVQAAIARAQLRRLPSLFELRASLARHLADRLRRLPHIHPPELDEHATSTYYLFAVRLDVEALGVSRATVARALAAEGVPFEEGYVRPIYLQAMYQRRLALGRSGCPWNCPHYDGQVSYEAGICPVAERMWRDELLVAALGAPPQTTDDMDDVARAFEKVMDALPALREWEGRGHTASSAAGRA